MAVVQDHVAAAAVEGEESGAAFLPLEDLLADGSRPGRAAVTGLRVGAIWLAGRLPAVVFDPVGDRIAVLRGLVAGAAEPPPGLGDELLPLPGVACGEGAPAG